MNPAYCALSATLPRTRRRARVQCCTGVPQNINEVVKRCARGLDAAYADGWRRMRVRALVPGLNVNLEDSFPYNERLLLMLVLSLARTASLMVDADRVNLRFKSAGTAASALKTYGGEELPANVNIAVYDDPQDVAGDVNIFINPVAARGNPVLEEIKRSVDRAPDQVWILLNSDFEADRAALGMKEQKLREDFVGQFVDCFYFRNLFIISRPKLIPVEKGAIVFTYGEPWTTYSLVDGDYKMADSWDSEPSSPTVSNAVQKGIDDNTEYVPQKIDDSEYLQKVSILFFIVFLLYSGIKYAEFHLMSQILL